MKHTSFFRSFVLMLLIAALAISVMGCFGNPSTDSDATQKEPVTFTFEVYLKDGSLKSTHEITTKKSTVGDALLENDLISGENGPYGLYVKVVDGVTADYDVDGTYWSFYVDGKYADLGVDSTPAENGKTYSFRIE